MVCEAVRWVTDGECIGRRCFVTPMTDPNDEV
jgi:hypothetical protein